VLPLPSQPRHCEEHRNVAARSWIASLSLAMTCVLFVMSPRLRKFIGTIALLILVVVWALVAMALAQMPAIRENAIVSVAYYVIAGLGWCLPAIPIVTWMSRKPRSHT
jgi:hypothetical protein